MTAYPKRLLGLDAAKFLCAFMVICIHSSYIGEKFFDPLTRIAVPVFFMITGYFYSSVKQRNRELVQIKKLIVLFLYSNLLYFVWNLVKCVIMNESIPDYLSIKVLIKFICFNVSPLSEHLWYLSALVYVLVFILLFDKYSNREKLYKFIPFLLLLNIVLGNYSTIILGIKLPLWVSRNFVFCGLPFFLLGDTLNKKQNKHTNRYLLIVAICSACLAVIENLVFIIIGREFNVDCFIATPILA